jgi:cyclic pyranopterin phosphate synthase
LPSCTRIHNHFRARETRIEASIVLEPLIDPFGRHVSSLRVSVTQRCDLACFFCHREGEHDPGKEMTTGEIGRIVEVAAGLGVTKIKVTGGEPMMRGDIVEVIRLISPHVN